MSHLNLIPRETLVIEAIYLPDCSENFSISLTLYVQTSHAVNRLALYMANLSLQHRTALKDILHYLSGTFSHSIVYKQLPENQDFFGYADAAHINRDKLRSITGYIFIIGSGAITWSSKHQIVHILSSTEAKYVALSKTVCKACWL